MGVAWRSRKSPATGEAASGLLRTLQSGGGVGRLASPRHRRYRVSMQDPYRVLNVSREAGQATIKAAYRALAKRLHPDRNPGDA
ncbi:MAG: J domain-containing protein, partial [Burkholderiales bacterium]